MADIEVWGVELADKRVKSLKVRFKNAPERTIDRDTALSWLAQGHSMLLTTGTHQHPHRGAALERVEVEGETFLRTDTHTLAEDHVEAGHH